MLIQKAKAFVLTCTRWFTTTSTTRKVPLTRPSAIIYVSVSLEGRRNTGNPKTPKPQSIPFLSVFKLNKLVINSLNIQMGSKFTVSHLRFYIQSSLSFSPTFLSTPTPPATARLPFTGHLPYPAVWNFPFLGLSCAIPEHSNQWLWFLASEPPLGLRRGSSASSVGWTTVSTQRCPPGWG